MSRKIRRLCKYEVFNREVWKKFTEKENLTLDYDAEK
jgi:hypothetical protein